MSYHNTIAPEHRDIEAWLGAKLEDPWASEKISSFLTNEILQHTKNKFSSMDTSIKLKLLHSFISLRKKSFKDMEPEIYEILGIGANDEDEWVRMISTMLMPLKEDKIAVDCVQGLDKVKAAISANGPPAFFPLEYQYLNSRLLPPLPASATTNSHFVLKREPTPFQSQNLKKPSILRGSVDISRHNHEDTEMSDATKKDHEYDNHRNGSNGSNGHNNNNNSHSTTSPTRHDDVHNNTPGAPSPNWPRRGSTSTGRPTPGLVSSPSPLHKSGGMFNRFDNSASAANQGQGTTERRGFQKKKKMQMIGILLYKHVVCYRVISLIPKKILTRLNRFHSKRP
jgi:hypothetical protein